jgi:hypothetical protein
VNWFLISGSKCSRVKDLDDEQPFPAVPVGQLAYDRQADREAERVDRDAPGAPVVGHIEVPIDRRQRRADDPVVERRHEDADGEQQQGPEMRSPRVAQVCSPFSVWYAFPFTGENIQSDTTVTFKT